MKQILFAAIAFVLAVNVSGQDIKKVRNYYDKKDWPNAKEAVELMLANEKEQKNWEAWYYKGLVYSQFGKDAALKGSIQDVWIQAYEAFQKAMELDPKQTETYMTLRSYPVFDSYLELQREGNDFYNKQDYVNALEKYKAADKVGRFIFKNKWALSEVDTVLYYYAGAAAMQAEKMDEAISFFQKICDAEIGGEGYDVCYRYVTYHYDSKKDFEKAQKYANIGRRLYPNDTYYDKLDLDRERKNGVGPELFKKYEAVLSKDAKDYDMRFDYAAEMFNWLFTDQKALADQKDTYFDKIVFQLNNCITVDSKKPDAYLLLGKVYFNDAAALQDELKLIKGTTPSDNQKKSELKKKMEDRMKSSIPNLENALIAFELGGNELFKERRIKNEYKTTIYLLVESNRFLSNQEEEKYYDKKYQEINDNSKWTLTEKSKVFNKYKYTINLVEPIQNPKQDQVEIKSERLGAKSTTVKITKKGGVYEIPCHVNGFPLNFIFDSGASNVSISLTEALFLLKNDKLEIIGKQNYMTADGNISEGTLVILREIKVGEIILKNIVASVTHTTTAPLLFGQSAMEKFGVYSFDYNNLLLKIGQ